jgi:HAD superfamily hydrolase (TIGR01459 family)
MKISAIPKLTGLHDLLPRFDVFFLDQFGVLHDGSAPYPGAVEALTRLKSAGKTILLLSNSGKRSAPNEARLAKLGFQSGSWDHFVSSGEVAWRHLAKSLPKEGLELRCLLIARDGDRSAVEGLSLRVTQTSEDAEIVLLAGSEGDVFTLDHYRRLLEPAAARRVTCVCTNPDKIMLTSVGPCFGAGRIAELYEEMGGPVHWIGKPFPEIYTAAKELLRNPTPSRIVCIGDSIEHDIVGGRRAGLSTALLASVLEASTDAGIDRLFAEYGASPDFLLPAFIW